MLTITIPKPELKRAFFGGAAEFSRELTEDGDSAEGLDIVLLKIMLENYKPINPEEAA